MVTINSIIPAGLENLGKNFKRWHNIVAKALLFENIKLGLPHEDRLYSSNFSKIGGIAVTSDGHHGDGDPSPSVL